MTFRELIDLLQQFQRDHPDHEALDRQVVVRVSAPSGDDDEDIYVGGLQSAVVDAGCADEYALVLDADQESDGSDDVDQDPDDDEDDED